MSELCMLRCDPGGMQVDALMLTGRKECDVNVSTVQKFNANADPSPLTEQDFRTIWASWAK